MSSGYGVTTLVHCPLRRDIPKCFGDLFDRIHVHVESVQQPYIQQTATNVVCGQIMKRSVGVQFPIAGIVHNFR